MKAVITIARRDLWSYFTSPKGMTIFWIFLLLMGIFFQNFIATFLELEQRAPTMGGQAPTLEQLLRAFFYNLHFILIFIIPAATMASFSEERKNHSLRLLFSTPVKATHIVLGKFFATAGFMALVLLASSVYPSFIIKYGNPDVGIILTSYLGVFLLTCSWLSFGIWISSMTRSQITAFLFTIFGLFFLLILNWIAPNLAGGGIAEGIIKYIASTEHLEVFFKGLLTVSDAVYFILFTTLFLFLTNVVLDSQRWR